MQRITIILGKTDWIPDEIFLKMAYRVELGKRLNLQNPVTLNEKLQWLKLNGAIGRFSQMVDKYAVREYVKKVLGEKHLVPTYGAYDRPEHIPWHDLPDQFVVKCTHGSHCGLICKDKSRFDETNAMKKLGRWMRFNWYWFGREPVYKSIVPRIIIEKYMGQGKELPRDYKVMCFNGKPRIVQVHEKQGKLHFIDFFDADGIWLDIGKVGYPRKHTGNLDMALLASLLEAARKLASSVDAPYLRTDFYWKGGLIYFSEMTFFDSSGFKDFTPENANVSLGDMLRLDYMTCPNCGHRMKPETISGSKWCNKIDRYDKCLSCGYERHVVLDTSS